MQPPRRPAPAEGRVAISLSLLRRGGGSQPGGRGFGRRYLYTVGGYDLCVFQWKHLQATGPRARDSAMLENRAD
mgnify:FL=1